MAKKFVRLRALSWPERRILAEALALMPVFWCALRLLGFRRCILWLIRPPVPQEAPLAFADAAKIADLINAVGLRLFGPDSCLIRSIYVLWLLRRLGVPCELRIGTQLTGAGLLGHAWVEVGGVPVNDAPDISSGYVVFEDSFT